MEISATMVGHSGGTIGGVRGVAAPPDSCFVTHGAPVHQVVNIKAYA